MKATREKLPFHIGSLSEVNPTWSAEHVSIPVTLSKAEILSVPLQIIDDSFAPI
jgi:hypothetical protein